MAIRVAVWGPRFDGGDRVTGRDRSPRAGVGGPGRAQRRKGRKRCRRAMWRRPGRRGRDHDASALLGGDADVVAYAAAANLRPLEAVNDMVSILRAGKNVVSCSVVPLVYPNAVDAAFTDPLREAALAGGVSFFTTGIDSGFANDVLPLALSGVARTIDSIRVTEMFNYATYPDATAVYDILGFGKPPEEVPFAATPAYPPSAGDRCCTSWPTAWGFASTTSRKLSSAYRRTSRSTPRRGTSPPEPSQG